MLKPEEGDSAEITSDACAAGSASGSASPLPSGHVKIDTATAADANGPTAGQKRTGDDAGLDDVHSADARSQKPKKPEPPERIMATESTIALVVTHPDDKGSPLEKIEIEVYVDDKMRKPNLTLDIDSARANTVFLIEGLNLMSKLSHVRVRVYNRHGPSPYSQAAYGESGSFLRCSAPTATIADLRAAAACAEIKSSSDLQSLDWSGLLTLYLNKMFNRPQLEFLVSDINKPFSSQTAKKDLISTIIEHSKDGSVHLDAPNDAAESHVDAVQKQLDVAKKTEVQRSGEVQDLAQAQVQAQAQASQAEKNTAAAADKLKAAQMQFDAAETAQRRASQILEKANTAQGRGQDALMKAQKTSAEKESALENAHLRQQALAMAALSVAPPLPIPMHSGAPTPPPVLGRQLSCGKQALKNRTREWVSDLSVACIRRMSKALSVRGHSTKPWEELVQMLVPTSSGYDMVAKLLQLPEETFSTKDLEKLYERLGVAPLTDRASMVEELISCLLAKPAAAAAASATAPAASKGLPPMDLLVVACSPRGAAHLPQVNQELHELMGVMPNQVSESSADPSRLQELLGLYPAKRFIFCGHGDAHLNHGQPTLCFTAQDGGIAAVPPDGIADMIGAIAKRGQLELVFLDGCSTDTLGHALIAQGVPCVVCWSSLVIDEVARVFAVAFFKDVQQRINQGAQVDYQAAFQAAKGAVLSQLTRVGNLSNGTPAQVSKYEFRKPQLITKCPGARPVDISTSDADYAPKPYAAGIPMILAQPLPSVVRDAA